MNIFLLEDDILQQQRLELIIREILVENRWSANSLITTRLSFRKGPRNSRSEYLFFGYRA